MKLYGFTAYVTRSDYILNHHAQGRSPNGDARFRHLLNQAITLEPQNLQGPTNCF